MILSRLSDHLGFWLHRTSRHASQTFRAKLARHDVTVGEWALMRLLHTEGSLQPSRAAAMLRRTRAAMTKLVDGLIANGLAVRTSNPRDARAQTVSLTRAGVAMMPVLANLADETEAECFGHLSEADRGHLRRILADAAARSGVVSLDPDDPFALPDTGAPVRR